MTLRELRFRMAGFLGSGLLSILGATWRYEAEGQEVLEKQLDRGEPFILAFWHSRILPLAYWHRGDGIMVLVSQHSDGEYIARVVQRMGLETARGSSTRGGARGLREIVKEARNGRSMAFTPDGPRGPARVFKAGALVAAKLTGAPIIPLAAGSARAWRLSSWDRFEVPRPFTRVQVRYGEPVHIPREADDAELSRLANVLEERLNRLTDRADQVVTGQESGGP